MPIILLISFQPAGISLHIIVSESSNRAVHIPHNRWCDTYIITCSTVWMRQTTRSLADSPCGSGGLRKIPLLDTAIPKQVFAGLKIVSTLKSSKWETRVTFDKLTKYISNFNPKHNAGYVHLCCLVKKMKFPMLCKDPNFKPEDRVLPLARSQENPIMIRDRTELDHVQRFIDFYNAKGCAPRSYPGLRTINDEILGLGWRELKGRAL